MKKKQWIGIVVAGVVSPYVQRAFFQMSYNQNLQKKQTQSQKQVHQKC